MRTVRTLIYTIRRMAVDQIPCILEPRVGIVDDATFHVLLNLVAVDEPLERRPTH